MAMLEYFKGDAVIYGKHATMVDEMWQQNDLDHSYFKRLVDLYTIAPIIGLRANRKVDLDSTGDNKRTVQLAQLMTRREDLLTIMQIILLMDGKDSLDIEKRIDRTFRGPVDENEAKENMDIFNAYVRGGIEVLHEKLVNRALTIDDPYTDRKVGNIMALLNDEF